MRCIKYENLKQEESECNLSYFLVKQCKATLAMTEYAILTQNFPAKHARLPSPDISFVPTPSYHNKAMSWNIINKLLLVISHPLFWGQKTTTAQSAGRLVYKKVIVYM